MLKKIRVVVSIVLFSLITLYFLDFRGFLPQSFSFLEKIQFIPALLAVNVAIIIILIALTLIFGRIYCSSVCPMGIFQDIIAWLSKKIIKRKRYTYSKAKTILRWSVLAAVVVTFLFGFTFLLGLLEPYGAYGRMATHLFRPIYMAGNNLLANILSSFGNYSLYKVSIYSFGFFSTIIATITLLGIGFLAWRNGRTYCNTICPAGTLLGFLSNFSFLKIQFKDERCNSCGLCVMKCKASCVDAKNKKIDYSRCVTCFNCIESCNRDAINYTFILQNTKKNNPALTKDDNIKKIKSIDSSRRRFLSATLFSLVTGSTLLAQQTTSKLLPKKAFKRQTPVAPPGAISFEHFKKKCISCHLCVSKCPSHVIKPAFLEYGLSGVMQPHLYFDHGYCNYNCTICGEVCPTGALKPLTVEEKHLTQMGQVQFIIENCIVYNDETSCGACSEVCPTQAVSMIPYKDALTIPHIDTSICIGCGGCESACPAIPYKAIYVEGLKIQGKASIKHEKQEQIEIKDFGF